MRRKIMRLYFRPVHLIHLFHPMYPMYLMYPMHPMHLMYPIHLIHPVHPISPKLCIFAALNQRYEIHSFSNCGIACS